MYIFSWESIMISAKHIRAWRVWKNPEDWQTSRVQTFKRVWKPDRVKREKIEACLWRMTHLFWQEEERGKRDMMTHQYKVHCLSRNITKLGELRAWSLEEHCGIKRTKRGKSASSLMTHPSPSPPTISWPRLACLQYKGRIMPEMAVPQILSLAWALLNHSWVLAQNLSNSCPVS